MRSYLAVKNYPPKNDTALRQLHQHICDASTVAVHHKLSILYYLLLNFEDRPSSRPSSRMHRCALKTSLTPSPLSSPPLPPPATLNLTQPKPYGRRYGS